jgi:hypothetical protein
MANKWLAHVKKTMKAHKGLKFGQVLKMAKKTYGKKGGADMPEEAAAEPSMEDTAVPAAGRRRRGTKKAGRKTRRAGRR